MKWCGLLICATAFAQVPYERIVKAAVEFVKTFLKENDNAHRTD